MANYKVEDALRRSGVGDEPAKQEKTQTAQPNNADFFKGKRPRNQAQLDALLLKRARG